MKTEQLLIALSLTISLCYAQPATSPLVANARINPVCSVSADNIALGDITPTDTSGQYVTSTGNINVKCTKQTAYNIFQEWGLYGDSNGRFLKNISTGVTKGYLICTTSGVTNGNCSNNKRWYPAVFSYTGYYISGIGTGFSFAHPVYVSTSKDYVTPGIYSDSVVTIISF